MIQREAVHEPERAQPGLERRHKGAQITAALGIHARPRWNARRGEHVGTRRTVRAVTCTAQVADRLSPAIRVEDDLQRPRRRVISAGVEARGEQGFGARRDDDAVEARRVGGRVRLVDAGGEHLAHDDGIRARLGDGLRQRGCLGHGHRGGRAGQDADVQRGDRWQRVVEDGEEG